MWWDAQPGYQPGLHLIGEHAEKLSLRRHPSLHTAIPRQDDAEGEARTVCHPFSPSAARTQDWRSLEGDISWWSDAYSLMAAAYCTNDETSGAA